MSDDHDLILGGFDLIRGTGDGWWVETIAEGMSFGEAEPNEVIQRTLLQDGDAVTIDRYGNRVITYQVRILARSAAILAKAGALLDAEIGKRSTLTWTPPSTPDEDAPPASVFEVFSSRKSFEFNDLGEVKPGTIGRIWTITLTCHPFAREADETVVSAVGPGEPPPTPSTTTVDECSSIGGWKKVETGLPETVTVVSGAIRVTKNSQPAQQSSPVRVRRDGVVNLTGTPYLLVDIKMTSGTVAYLSSTVLRVDDGSPIYPVATGPSPDDNTYTRLWFLPEVASFSTMTLSVNMIGISTGLRGLGIDKVIRTNVGPYIGSGAQQFRQLQVGGSARALGSLLVEHETLALGDTLVYTNAEDGSGYQPSCRQYRVAGGSQASDSTAVSGTADALNGGTAFTVEIPAGRVPAGSYAALGRLRAAATGFPGINWNVSSMVGTTKMGARSGSTTFGLTASTWTIQQVANVTLPTVALAPGSSSKIRIELASASALEIDELWLFNMTTGDLTWVNCGTASPSAGGSSNRLWVDTANLDWPRPAVWLGNAADGSDRRHVLAATEEQSRGTHTFPPGVVNLFTVTPNAPLAAASLRFFRRFMDLVAPAEDAA